MSLFKRGNTWWAYAWIEGNRHAKSTGTSNRRQAEAILRQFREELNERRHRLPQLKPEMTFGELTAHFIAGGMFEAYFDMGRKAGVQKERLNSVTGDYFDYNKVAVTTMGARWVDVAVEGDAQHAKRWLELWASGRYTLSKSMPKLHWESLPPFVDSTPERVKAVEDEVAAAITFTDDTSVPPVTQSH